MAAGENPQSKQASVQLEKRVCTALWGLPRPKGPFCFRGTLALLPDGGR